MTLSAPKLFARNGQGSFDRSLFLTHFRSMMPRATKPETEASK